VRPVISVVRSELTRRLLPFVALVVVVTVLVAVVAFGLAGARRTASVVDRMRNRLAVTDVVVRGLSPDLGTDPQAGVRLADALSDVDGVTDASVSVGFPVDAIPPEYFMVYASPDDSVFRSADRPIVRSGRLPVRDAPNEIAVNEQAAKQLGVGVGDSVSGPTLTHGATEGIFSTGDFPGFVGPTLNLDVVGVVTLPTEVSGRRATSGPQAVGSPAFAERYGDQIDSYVTEVHLRTTDTSPALIGRVVQAAGDAVGEYEVNVLTTEDLWADSLTTMLRTVAFTIAGVALFLAAAGLLVGSQWVRREVMVAGAEDRTLCALGLTRFARAACAAGPAVVAVAVGSALGLAVAAALSGLFPVGVARSAEVDPGLRVDPIAMLSAMVVSLLLVVVALLAGRRVTSSRAEPRRSPGRVSQSLARLGVRPSAAIGAGMALEVDRGPRSVPARSAVLAAVVALAGITAVVVIGSSSAAVIAEPARFGQTWSATPDVLAEDQTVLAEATMGVDGMAGLADIGFTQVGVDGRPEPAMAIDVLGGTIHLAVLDGRVPVDVDEVAVSRSFAEVHDISVGDTIDVDDPEGGSPKTLEVVGMVIGPMIDDQARTIVLSPDGLMAYALSEPTGYAAVRYDPSADAEVVESELTELGYRFTENSRAQVPAEVLQFRSVNGLFLAALALVALLGAAGIAHVLAISARRRRGDFAVLRAFGFLRPDVRSVLSVQAVVVTVIGVVVGMPLGILLASVLWRLAVHRLGIMDEPSMPWGLLVGSALVAVLGSLLIAVPVGAAAARRPIAVTLRAE